MEIYTNNFWCFLFLLDDLNTYIAAITKENVFSILGSFLEGSSCSIVAHIRDFIFHIFNKLFIFDGLFELNFFGLIGNIGMSGLNFIRWMSNYPDVLDLLERERDRENLNTKYNIS